MTVYLVDLGVSLIQSQKETPVRKRIEIKITPHYEIKIK